MTMMKSAEESAEAMSAENWRKAMPKLEKLSHAVGNKAGADITKAIDEAIYLLGLQKMQMETYKEMIQILTELKRPKP